MKKSLPVLLILIYLLCGCAAGTHTDNSAAFPVQTSAAVPGYYDPDSMLEAQTNGALRCYPLGVTGAVSFRLLPDRRLLWIAFDSDATTLTILEGQECIPISTLRLPFSLQGTEYAIQPCGDGLSCFDPVSRETLVLNAELQETDRVSAPAGLDGIPLLSRDGSRLYYTADNALRVLERSSGISSVLKRSSTTQFPTSLVLDGAPRQAPHFTALTRTKRSTRQNRSSMSDVTAHCSTELWKDLFGNCFRQRLPEKSSPFPAVTAPSPFPKLQETTLFFPDTTCPQVCAAPL